MSQTNNNNALHAGDHTEQPARPPVPGLVWVYGLWIVLAALSYRFGLVSISTHAAVFLLGGICSTNFFFIMVQRSAPHSAPFRQLLATYQAILGIAWTSAYFYFSSGSGDIADVK